MYSVEEFLRDKSVGGKAKSTLEKYTQILRDFQNYLGKEPYLAIKEEILGFFEYLKSKGYKQNSLATYAKAIKAFFKWCKRWNQLEEEGLELLTKTEEVINKTNLLTEEELQLIILKAPSYRDRAFISSLWESGMRISEFLSLNINSVIPTDYGFDLVIQESKTQTRVIPLWKSSRYLSEWINSHPCRDNPQAPLWCTVKGKRLTRLSAWTIVKKLAKRVGIKKKVHPHLLRHTRLTELSQQVREPVLKAFAGWSPSSNMVSRYVHLSGQDIKENLLAAQGIIPPKPIEFLPLKECPRCKAKNENLNEYCFQCGYPLVKDKPIVVRDLGKINELEAEIEELKRDTEIAIHHAVNQAVEKEAREWKQKLDKILELVMEGK